MKFKYKLDGFDHDWIETGGNNAQVYYPKLNHGNYIFRIKAANPDGLWSKEIKQLKINIAPPWYLSIWAKLIYGVLIFGLLYFLYHWIALKNAYRISIIQKDQEDQLHQFRMQFFTNISHEFRTPLTLIMNPLEELMKGSVPGRKQKRYYSHMLSNTKRLLRLINELMDFRKIETKSYKLNLEKEDLEEVVEEVCENFEDLAMSKEINFCFQKRVIMEPFWFDRAVVEKILYNLLGNSFKFTSNGGQIIVNLINELPEKDLQNNTYRIWDQKPQFDYVWLEIIDSGKGISAKELESIFDRFFHRSSQTTHNSEGSGIGLSLVKSLVVLNEGSIVVHSVENVGTKFYISVPIKRHLSKDNFTDGKISLSKSSLSPVYNRPQLEGSSQRDFGKSSILIVEDNTELRIFLKENFEEDFYVIEAANGAEALKILKNFIPDLIVSDLKMPIMNGLELCEKVKNLKELSNIPFIMLTANINSQLDAVQANADLFFPKPFSIDVLRGSILNLISNRKALKTNLLKNTLEEAFVLKTKNKDNDFLKKTTQLILENIEQTDFDVNTLSSELGMSRTKVYSQIKLLTGKSPGELIREIRLKTAAGILASEDISITQAMFRVGIQSQSYFIKIFKKEYGKTPSQFVQELTTKN